MKMMNVNKADHTISCITCADVQQDRPEERCMKGYLCLRYKNKHQVIEYRNWPYNNEDICYSEWKPRNPIDPLPNDLFEI